MQQGKQPTYYEFFNLPNFETDAIKIKRAYRSMALKWHPDRNTDKSHAEHMMKQVNEIYRILSQDKNAYDHHLRAKLGQGPTQKKYQKSGYESPINKNQEEMWEHAYEKFYKSYDKNNYRKYYEGSFTYDPATEKEPTGKSKIRESARHYQQEAIEWLEELTWDQYHRLKQASKMMDI